MRGTEGISLIWTGRTKEMKIILFMMEIPKGILSLFSDLEILVLF